MMETGLSAMAYCGIPAAVTAFAFWGLKRTIERKEKLHSEREKAREQSEYLMVKCIGASLALGEATAYALKYGKCNGEMSNALEYAKSVKHEQRDFLQKQGIGNLYE
jgi:hypothetical protein